MKTKEIYSILSEQIPQKGEWNKMSGEAYGHYNCEEIWEKDIRKALYCVTTTDEVKDYAKENGYDLIVAHHPVGLSSFPIFVFHTAMDCCEGGMNDIWRNHMDLVNPEHFDGELGWHGKLKKPMAPFALLQKVAGLSGDIIGDIFIDKGVDKIESVVICTGLGGMVIDTAAKTNADCYILGENTTTEKHGFKSIIEVGHTHSEWVGVKLIRKLLADTDVEIGLAPIGLDRFGAECCDGVGLDWNPDPIGEKLANA